MTLPDNAPLLRLFVGESVHFLGKPLYKQIVLKARELNLAGATVTRGVMGCSRLHTATLPDLSTDLPMVIEIVDAEESIAKLTPRIDESLSGGPATLEKVRVMTYRHDRAP